MAIEVGSKIPDVGVKVLRDGAPTTVQTGDILGSGKVVLIAVPGAFTPGCSKLHLPGYVQNADALRAKGIDTIACISVNDAWVMDAWGEAQGAGDIVMLADGNGEFADAMGLTLDGSGAGLGTRSQRYAAVIEDGVITDLEIEPNTGVDVSSCDNLLTKV
ncbi:MAG TPA: peroxiredoxin [Mycobacteriales bacterium]|jgi:peroxiredoxin|nr:peroxiredoxin [Mycobacteriales bacterium]